MHHDFPSLSECDVRIPVCVHPEEAYDPAKGEGARMYNSLQEFTVSSTSSFVGTFIGKIPPS